MKALSFFPVIQTSKVSGIKFATQISPLLIVKLKDKWAYVRRGLALELRYGTNCE